MDCVGFRGEDGGGCVDGRRKIEWTRKTIKETTPSNIVSNSDARVGRRETSLIPKRPRDNFGICLEGKIRC
jgi:hypothetical protein